MSNEYKDWYEDFTPNQKRIYDICMEYPFLIPREMDGSEVEDFDYAYLGLEIPSGWYRLFFQMCNDIKPLLEREGVLEDFYFLQVKEKFNELVCFSNGVASQEVEDIINKYQHMAYYICTKCGQPATYMTTGYWSSFCDDCWKDLVKHQKVQQIRFEPYYEAIRFSKGEQHKKIISFEEEWNRYLEELNNEE